MLLFEIALIFGFVEHRIDMERPVSEYNMQGVVSAEALKGCARSPLYLNTYVYGARPHSFIEQQPHSTPGEREAVEAALKTALVKARVKNHNLDSARPDYHVFAQWPSPLLPPTDRCSALHANCYEQA